MAIKLYGIPQSRAARCLWMLEDQLLRSESSAGEAYFRSPMEETAESRLRSAKKHWAQASGALSASAPAHTTKQIARTRADFERFCRE